MWKLDEWLSSRFKRSGSTLHFLPPSENQNVLSACRILLSAGTPPHDDSVFFPVCEICSEFFHKTLDAPADAPVYYYCQQETRTGAQPK